MGAHLIEGTFQSDKYPGCPAGKVPLSVKDVTAQDLLWTYAQRRRAVDAEFSDDLETALRNAGYVPSSECCSVCGHTEAQHAGHDRCSGDVGIRVGGCMCDEFALYGGDDGK